MILGMVSLMDASVELLLTRMLRMGVSSYFSQTIRNNYVKMFGPFNQQITIRNHTFVLLDAPGLVDEDYQRSAHGSGFGKWRAIPGGTVAFVKTITRGELFQHPTPYIVLTYPQMTRLLSCSVIFRCRDLTRLPVDL